MSGFGGAPGKIIILMELDVFITRGMGARPDHPEKRGKVVRNPKQPATLAAGVRYCRITFRVTRSNGSG
jgi:hypothetical protein